MGGQGGVLDISIQGDGHSYRTWLHDDLCQRVPHGSFVWRICDFVVLCSDGNRCLFIRKNIETYFLLPDAFAFSGIKSDYRGRSGIIQKLGVSHGCNSLVLLEDTRRGDGFNSDGVDSVALVTLCSHGGCFLRDLPPLGGQDFSYRQTGGIMARCRISYFRWCCVYSRERRFQRGPNEREFRVFQ